MKAAVLSVGLCLVLSAACAQPVEDPGTVAKSLFPKDEELLRRRLGEIAGAMALHAGSQVADVGCGGGETAVLWSRAAGPTGHVWAEDISQWAVKSTRKLAGQKHARNVTVIKGEVADPHLPAGKLDAISLFLVYHELVKHQEMLARFHEALKPDGRLVIFDPMPVRTRDRTRDAQTRNHVMNPELVQSELRAAGFEVVRRDDHFVDDPDSERPEWLIVAKPVAH